MHPGYGRLTEVANQFMTVRTQHGWDATQVPMLPTKPSSLLRSSALKARQVFICWRDKQKKCCDGW